MIGFKPLLRLTFFEIVILEYLKKKKKCRTVNEIKIKLSGLNVISLC